MKNYFCAATLVAGALFGLASCTPSRQQQAGTADDGDSLYFCTVEFADSAIFVNASVNQDIKVDFPVPEAQGILADSIRVYLADAVVAHNNPLGKLPSLDTLVYVFGAEQAFVEACVAAGIRLSTEELQSMVEDGWTVNFEHSYTAAVMLQTDNYVTFSENTYTYLGGAHGSSFAKGITFRRSDGCQMGWNLIDMDKKELLLELIKDELCTYFAADEGRERLSDEELMETLMLWDDPDTPEDESATLPLPRVSPYVVRDGIAFIYQQYEIAAYACGLPSGVIPFEAIRPCLSDEGRALLGL